ncbi:ICMT-domain-containing protein [Abortiporus biennis]|nr:ICMT-domain-containing protein [Abortiporus biennis]
MSTASDVPEGFEERLQQREATIRNPLEMRPIKLSSKPDGRIPNTPAAVATVAAILGGVFSLGLLLFLSGGFSTYWWTTWQLGFFISAWSFFHWAEFTITAGWNLEKCCVDSFLLENGAMYHVAHISALAEYLLTLYFKPSIKSHSYISIIGIVLAISGQALRSAAMIHASTSFSHTVAFRKLNTHTLVTDGVYAYFRHPSYAGFFYWALGTQMVLQNPANFILFTIILWKFFSSRIKPEERGLVKFFGQEYEEYRRRVGTKIPFIP